MSEAELREQLDLALEALDSEGEWVTNAVVYAKIDLSRLGDIEAGVRQLIRRAPVEVVDVTLSSGASLHVPSIEEALRIKAFLALRRNRGRDYFDVAALSQRMGWLAAAATLNQLDAFYADQHAGGDGVASQVARQLADPQPVDADVLASSDLDPQAWSGVVEACLVVGEAMVVEGTS